MVNYSLLGIFMEGKTQTHLIKIAEMIEKFIGETAPILEEINHRANWFKSMTMMTASSDKIGPYLRKDLESAKLGLIVYNRMFGQVDYILAMVSSTFGLAEFLELNGIPRSEVGEYQKLLQGYWNETYGLTINKFKRVHPHLNKLRETIELEIELLQEMPRSLYEEGLDEMVEIHRLWDVEREAFYNLVQEWNTDNDDQISILEAFLDTQLLKAKEWASSLLAILRANLKYDLQNSQSTGRKILIVLQYALGALYVALKIRSFISPTKAVGWGIGKGIKAIGDRLKLEAKLKGIQTRSVQVQKAAKELITASAEEALRTGLMKTASMIEDMV